MPGAIRPVTEKAVRYFILTSRWTESARRGAARRRGGRITIRRTTMPSRRIAPRRTMTFIVSLSILCPQSINSGLDSRDRYARSLAPSLGTNYERIIGGNFLPPCYRIILGCSMFGDNEECKLDQVFGNDQTSNCCDGLRVLTKEFGNARFFFPFQL